MGGGLSASSTFIINSSEAHPLATCAWRAELKEELAEAQGSQSEFQEDLVGVPESQLAAMQQQHTADMLQAVAEYVRHGAKSGGCHAPSPEDSLAAMQQRHTVKLINEVTHYLQEDMQDMQQMCEMISAQPHPHRSLKHHRTRGLHRPMHSCWGKSGSEGQGFSLHNT